MTATFLPPGMLSNGRFPFTKHPSAYMAGNCQAQGRYPSGTAFLYPTLCLQLLGGTALIYHPILQSFMWTETVPRSSLCQRAGIQESFVV